MKSLIRVATLLFTAITLVVSVAIAPGLTAYAQDTCFGLNADDCNLVKAASTPEAYAKLTSFTMTHVNTITTSSASGNNNLDVSITGNGAYSSDQPFVVTTPATETPDESLTLQDTTTITTKRAGKDARSINFEIRIVNATVYFQTSAGKWVSTSLAKMRGNSIAMLTVFGDPSQLRASLKAAFEALARSDIVGAERSADTTVENQQIASFVYHFDLAKASSEGNLGPIIKLLGGRLGTLDKLSDEELNSKKDQLAKALKNTQLTITRYVGVTDKLPHGIAIDVIANIDPQDLVGLAPTPSATSSAPGTSPLGTTGPIMINTHYELKLSGIGNKVDVTAPANAVAMP